MKKTYISIIMAILVLLPATIIGQDTKDKIKSIIDSYPLESYQETIELEVIQGAKPFAIYSKLPKRSLKKAIKKYAKGKVTREDVLIFYYSVIGPYGCSFIVTEEKIFYWMKTITLSEKMGAIELKSISEFRMDDKFLIVYGNDGNSIAELFMQNQKGQPYTKSKARKLIQLLDEIVYVVNPSKEKIAKQNTEITEKKQSGSNFELTPAQVICECLKNAEYYNSNENTCDSYINSALGFNWKTTNFSQNAEASRKFDHLQSMCR